MFIRPKKPEQEPHVRHTLAELGYEFDLDSGDLVSKTTGEVYTYNQPGKDKKRCKEVYESLVQAASREVYNIITANGSGLGMQPIAVPDANQPHCTIYATRGALSKKHLVVLVTGHGNFAAVWGWNVLVKCGLNKGSVVEYIRECEKRGFGVVLLNPNENIVAPDGVSETFNSYSGRSIPIRGSETPNEHVGYVWSHIIRDSEAQSVAFVLHGSAGTAGVDLLKYDFARFTAKVVCIAFVDSIHSTFMLTSGAITWLGRCAKQWEPTTSTATTTGDVGGAGSSGTAVVFSDRLGCAVVEVANDSEFRELTTALCMDELLDYVESSFRRGPLTGIPESRPEDDNNGLDHDHDLGSGAHGLDDVQFINNTYKIKPSGKDGYVGWE
ncbi:hypothetical protein H4217_002369 [Coemansia sp. RSA 1939]|nr:hypothetical protein H4217_002369 [Coemansia sp. RSA 1939]